MCNGVPTISTPSAPSELPASATWFYSLKRSRPPLPDRLVRTLIRNPRSATVTYEKSVPGPALFQTAAHALHRDVESGIAQALLEPAILAGGPDGQHAADLERGAGGRQPAIVVEPGVVCSGECGRAVVHVE